MVERVATARLRFGLAALIVMIAMAFRLLLDPLLGDHYVYSPLLIAVLITSWYAGRGPAFFALALGAIASSYFLLQPRGALYFGAPDHNVGLLLYLLTGGGIAALAGSMHSAQQALRGANDALEERVRARTDELARSGERLRVSEEHFRLLVEGASGHAIIMLDPDGKIVTWNSGAAQLTGYTSGEATGQHFSLLYPADAVAEGIPDSTLERATASGRIEEEAQRIRKDGMSFWANVTVAPILDRLGGPLGFVMVLHDISERWKLEETQRLFRSLLDRSDDAVEVIEPATGRFLDGNEKAWQSLGYSRSEYLTLHVFDIDPRVASKPWTKQMNGLRQAGGTVFETLHRRKDGSQFPVEVNVTCVELSQEYMVAVVRDITGRKRVERRVEAQHEVGRILSESLSLEDGSAQTLEVLCGILEWKRGELWSVDRSAGVLRCISACQEESADGATFCAAREEMTFARGIGLPGRVWAEGAAVWIPDVRADPSIVRSDLVTRMGCCGAAGFPIQVGSDVIGVFCLFNAHRVEQEDDLSQILTAVGNQIGQFVERKHAEHELRTSEERFRELAESIREVFWLNDVVRREII